MRWSSITNWLNQSADDMKDEVRTHQDGLAFKLLATLEGPAVAASCTRSPFGVPGEHGILEDICAQVRAEENLIIAISS